MYSKQILYPLLLQYPASWILSTL